MTATHPHASNETKRWKYKDTHQINKHAAMTSASHRDKLSPSKANLSVVVTPPLTSTILAEAPAASSSSIAFNSPLPLAAWSGVAPSVCQSEGTLNTKSYSGEVES
jgi:hypothetical protein